MLTTHQWGSKNCSHESDESRESAIRDGPYPRRSEAQSDLIVGDQNPSQAKTSLWTWRLEEQTRNPVPVSQWKRVSLFWRAGRSELVFQQEAAYAHRRHAEGAISIPGKVQVHRDPSSLEPAVHAIRTAARSEPRSTTTTPGSADDGKPSVIGRQA
jgi:hypothetical protein